MGWGRSVGSHLGADDAVPVSVLYSPVPPGGFVRVYKKALLLPLPSGRASNSQPLQF